MRVAVQWIANHLGHWNDLSMKLVHLVVAEVHAPKKFDPSTRDQNVAQHLGFRCPL